MLSFIRDDVTYFLCFVPRKKVKFNFFEDYLCNLVKVVKNFDIYEIWNFFS